MIYKVSCEYYVEAENLEQAQNEVIDEFASGGFFESHIIIESSELPKGEKPFNA